MYTHDHTFSHPWAVNPLIMGGNWGGGGAKIWYFLLLKSEWLCCKAWFPHPSSFSSLKKCDLWPLQGPTHSLCHLELDTVCVCVSVNSQVHLSLYKCFILQPEFQRVWDHICFSILPFVESVLYSCWMNVFYTICSMLRMFDKAWLITMSDAT